jgi:hypothetical protein
MSETNLAVNSDTINANTVNSVLSPANCYSPQAIKSFLTVSRKYSDYHVHVDIPRTGSCESYVKNTLFTHWLSRDYILDYCIKVADNATAKTQAAEEKFEKEGNPIDPRIDPYGNRDYGYKPPAPEAAIYSWVSYEKNIEEIIRQDTIKFLIRKCGPSLLQFHSASDTRITSSDTYSTLYEQYKLVNKDLYKC